MKGGLVDVEIVNYGEFLSIGGTVVDLKSFDLTFLIFMEKKNVKLCEW